MNIDELRAGYRRLMENIYAPRPYYRRVRTFLREFKQPKFSFTMKPRLWMAFAHSSVRLGIFGRERIEYWRLLAWTCLRRPASFQVAVTLAIYGHHFRKCCAGLAV
jgi:hypothetical protein